MKSTPSMTVSVRRSLRKTGRALRRSAPAVVAVCILAALVGGTLAGVLTQ
jgi:hypothetical protein